MTCNHVRELSFPSENTVSAQVVLDRKIHRELKKSASLGGRGVGGGGFEVDIIQ